MLFWIVLILISSQSHQQHSTDDQVNQTIAAILGLATNVTHTPSNTDASYKVKLNTVFGTEDKPFHGTTTEVNLDQKGHNPNGIADNSTAKDQTNESQKCMTEIGVFGVCALYYLCDSYTSELITDGSLLLDIREKNSCGNYLEICCLKSQVVVDPPKPPAQVDSSYPGCGYSNPGAYPFRTNGAAGEAEYGEFPWMVAVLKNSDVTWVQTDYIGGGSLIHWSVVLTVAHKVQEFQPKDIKIRAGEWDTQHENEVYKFQEQVVRKIVKHEDFYRPSLLNSVALLFLERPVVRAPHVDLVCLGSSLPPPGTTCFTMGWGKNQFAARGQYAVVLKKVEMPLVSKSACENSLKGTRLGSYFRLHPSFVCAGGKKGVDACQGDGGSPLVCAIGKGDSDRYAQYGGVSWGIGCGNELPGVYTDFVYFKDWIVKKVTDEGIDAKIFTLD